MCFKWSQQHNQDMQPKCLLPSNHLILCTPLLHPSSIFLSITVFSNESALRIRWPKYWSFSFNIRPSNEYSGLISQRSKPVLPHCRQVLYQLSYKGSPKILEWVAYPFSRGSSRQRNQTPGLLPCRRILYQLSYKGSPSKASVQFSSVAQSYLTLCDPMNCSMPGLPVHHQLLEFTQTHVHRVGDAIQPSHPLSSPSPPAPNSSQHQGLFQRVNSLHEVAKVLEFQL